MKSKQCSISPPVISLVGCSNSGKTTFLEQLIQELRVRGYRIGTIKHHRGDFEFDIPGKDTWRHAQAGADMVALATPAGFGVAKKLNAEMPLQEIVSHFRDVDIILLEGMKKGPQPKIELVRSAVSQSLVCPIDELLAVVSDLPLQLGPPLYDLEDIVGVADLIEHKFFQSTEATYHNELSETQKKRYHRNVQIPGVGEEGQLRLLNSSVLVVGAGGLGSPVTYYLAAAGIGRIGIVDGDSIEYSNLQRQILHRTVDLGRLKVDSAKEKLEALNPDICVTTYPFRIDSKNVLDLVQQYDIVVDATDNLETRYYLNQACINAGKPFIYGGVLAMVGQVMTILPGKGPCFRCIFRELSANKTVKTTDEVGILGSVAGIIGTIQATEVVKYLWGKNDLLVGRMLTMDAMSMSFQEVEVGRDPQCPDCGHIK